MNMQSPTTIENHGGLLFPLDMFRPTLLAAALGEGLVAKVRNIVDAHVELIRHPRSQLVLLRIEGSTVGTDAGEFWLENMDLLLIASQVLPRQVFLYYVKTSPQRREGFAVAQRGQVLAADDSERGGNDNHWPVQQLCQQMQISLQELAEGFLDGPRIELSLLEPQGNDQELLMTLAGQGPPEEEVSETQATPSSARLTPGRTAKASAAKGINIEQDRKRREAEKIAEDVELQSRTVTAYQNLKFVEDEVGVIVAPHVELAETAILAPFLVTTVNGSIPSGLPTNLQDRLQGKAIDIAVRVEFLSEVFYKNQPLNKAIFAEHATDLNFGSHSLKALEVHAPRLGAGMLIRQGNHNLFVSRKMNAPLPEAFILEQLQA